MFCGKEKGMGKKFWVRGGEGSGVRRFEGSGVRGWGRRCLDLEGVKQYIWGGLMDSI